MNVAILTCLAIIILLSCATISFLAFVVYSTIKYLKEKDTKDSESKYRDIDIEKIDKLFNDIIEREFNEYHKFHPELSQEGSYIKRDEIHDIITVLTSKVYSSITPAIKYNMSLIYDVSTDDKLINLIGERVGVLVMAMAATINSTLIDDTRVNIEV